MEGVSLERDSCQTRTSMSPISVSPFCRAHNLLLIEQKKSVNLSLSLTTSFASNYVCICKERSLRKDRRTSHDQKANGSCSHWIGSLWRSTSGNQMAAFFCQKHLQWTTSLCGPPSSRRSHECYFTGKCFAWNKRMDHPIRQSGHHT